MTQLVPFPHFDCVRFPPPHIDAPGSSINTSLTGQRTQTKVSPGLLKGTAGYALRNYADIIAWNGFIANCAGTQNIFVLPVPNLARTQMARYQGSEQKPMRTIFADGTTFDDGTGFSGQDSASYFAFDTPEGATEGTLICTGVEPVFGAAFTAFRYHTIKQVTPRGAGRFDVKFTPPLGRVAKAGIPIEIDAPFVFARLMSGDQARMGEGSHFYIGDIGFEWEEAYPAMIRSVFGFAA